MSGGKMGAGEYVPFAIEVQVRDFQRSLKFYRDVLRFRVLRVNVENNFASLSFNGSIFMVKEVAGLPEPRGAGVKMRFILVGDLKKYHDEVKERGAEIANTIEKMPYGLTRFYLRDPDGYELKFAAK